jgi:hemoglobin
MRGIFIGSVLCLFLIVPARAQDSPTLFDQLGGGAILRATVSEFMDIVLADDRINFAFAEADLDKFKHSLYTHLCWLANGPCRYEGRDMRTAHEKLGITNLQFNAVAEDLYLAMDRAGVSYRAQNKLMALLAPMQKEIVKK